MEARSPVRAQRARHPPDRLRDDGDSDELEAMEQARSRGTAQRAGAVGEENEHNRRRQREAGPRRERAAITGPHQPDRKSNLAGRRTRQKLTQRHEIDKSLFVEPAPAHDELFTEIADVRDRPAE